ncbi:hypothetical protein [Mucilaginibacter sp. L196]|uniref:hypothetical protein n=1 Tax=Mucilaginibacter sp. L196 TaxID=1641870 RepID=UPI00131E3F64|nr:hypothetical protein [Mucilaginibacter sp. L196]
MQELYKVEHLPDVKALIAAGKISIKSIIQLRRKSVASKFRTWLVTHTEDDTEYIVKQYIEEIAGHKGLLEKGTGKFIKMIGVYGIGIGVGAAIGDIPGSIVGAGTSKLLEDTVSLGISMIDSYLLDGILKGWQPRFFISEYQKVISQPEQG